MTLTYDDPGVAYESITWSYEGTELNLGPYAPTVFLDAEGPYITSESASGALAAYAKTGNLAAYTASNLLISLAKTGTLTNSFAASGSLLAYTATGVIED